MLRQQGVTLLELLVVIIISTILIVSAQLLLSPLLKRLESQRITDEIYQLCLHSRALAAHMKLPLTLCGSSNGEQCDNNWAEGVLLFIDQNRSHRFEVGETRLQYRSLQIGSSTLTWKGFGGHKLLLVEVAACDAPPITTVTGSAKRLMVALLTVISYLLRHD